MWTLFPDSPPKHHFCHKTLIQGLIKVIILAVAESSCGAFSRKLLRFNQKPLIYALINASLIKASLIKVMFNSANIFNGNKKSANIIILLDGVGPVDNRPSTD